jgi:predicted ribosome quality control (RQC) complex YloA/Tae2 family protein
VKRDLSDYQERQIKDSQLEIDSLKLEAFLLDYGFLPPLEFVVNRENNWEYTDGENNKINLVVGQDGKYDVFKNGTPTLKNPIYDEGIDWDEISDLVEERKSEIESEIDSIEYDIEQIKEEPEGDPDEDDVENEVESLLDQIKDDPVRWLDDYSIDYKQFIDINSLIRDLIDEGDYDVLATYDGTYDEIDINGESYIVYRVD